MQIVGVVLSLNDMAELEASAVAELFRKSSEGRAAQHQQFTT